MKKILSLVLLAIPAALAAAPAVNWVSRVTMTPIGGHYMGNPAAQTKLVEYVSYTCSHCAHFVRDGTAPLKADYVKSGKVGVEVRNAVRDKYDLAAALLARCGGPARFMGNHEALFANQDAWMPQIVAYDGSADARPVDQVAALQDIGQKTGLYALMNKRGFTSAQLNACVASAQSMKQVLAMTDEAWNRVKITGTPGFVVDGTLVKGSTWDQLKAALPAPAR
ncbi:protein-disulfide isomerase [Sphingobium amiense]|uniref:Protein-disulfide isomerase n=1 Tax=Sphingobium amiense TaxID=135719 RepID=A0A494WFI8_9SPHN|nr:thioredoxin domain-containing protein [Sphingobium amiense]BBD99692.1 protein-disulfide isomerase [Sphingobium amiense]